MDKQNVLHKYNRLFKKETVIQHTTKMNPTDVIMLCEMTQSQKKTNTA